MNIAILYDAIYPYVIGGAEKRNRECAELLAARGHRVTLAGLKYWQGPDVTEVNGVTLAGICPSMPLNGPDGKRSKREAVLFGWQAYRHLRSSSYDVVDCLSFPFFSCLAAGLALRGKKTALGVTWLEVWDRKYWMSYAGASGRAGWMLQKMAASRGVRKGAISAFTASRLETELGVPRETVDVIPCGIDLRELSLVSGDPLAPRILYSGRLARHKKVEDLIIAFAAVKQALAKALPGLTLTITGRGPEEERLRRLAKESGAGDAVTFEGFVDRDKLLRLMKGSLAFVLPSEREGMGIVVAEAMALGVPVIARDAEGSAVPSIVEAGKDALLFRTREELERCLVSLATDAPLRGALIENGRASAGKYDLSTRIVPLLESWYNKLAEERQRQLKT